MSRKRFQLILTVILLILTPLLMADVGPKPTAEFEIEYQIEPVPELTGYGLYECRDPDCREADLLEELGPQRFECEQDSCFAMAYGFADTMYIELSFSDGVTRKSNIFTHKHFNAEYSITVSKNDLTVKEIGGSPPGGIDPLSFGIYLLIGLGCCLPLLLAAIIVTIVILLRRKKKQGGANIDQSETMDTP